MNKKGATSIFTGIMILLLSVFVMIIIITLATPFFNNLGDSLRYNGNKRIIFQINDQLLNLKNTEIGTTIDISVFPLDDIAFDNETNTITIRQEIKNTEYSQNYAKELNYNNLNIKKENNEIVFTLDLTRIIDVNTPIILNKSRQNLKVEVSEIVNGVPTVNITQTSGLISRILLSPQTAYFAYTRVVIATTVPADSNIYYTIDGTDPDQNAILYTGPLTITETTTIKFKAFKEGYDSSQITTGTYTKVDGLSFFNRYTNDNPTADLSDNNAEIINNNILFGTNGAYFNNNSNNYLFIKNDWNNSHPELNLGNNNFTLEASVSEGYKGHIFSKTGIIGGMDLSINNDGIANFTFSGNDQFWYPYGLTQDENYIYISEVGSHRVQKRRKDNWELVLISGGPRATTAITGYSSPYGLAVDDTFIYISDYSNCRIIKRYKENFDFNSMLSNGCSTADNQVRYNWGIAVDETSIYVTELSYHRVKKFNKTTFALEAKIGGTAAGSGEDQFSSPRGIAVDDTYIYIADSGNNRLKKHLKSTLAYVSHVGGTAYGSGNDQFYGPYGVSVDNSYIYVADYSNLRIMIRNKDTTMSYYNKIVSAGLYADDDYIYTPIDVSVDDNYIYLTEYSNQRIKKYNKSDYAVASIYSKILPNDETMIAPTEIDNDGEYLYYTDSTLHRLVKRRISDMAVMGVVGGPYAGSTNTLFSTPQGLAVKGNRIYVADFGNSAIKIYNKDTLAWVYTCIPGTAFFRYPRGIAYDDNYFYVTTTYSTTMDSLHKLEITDSSCSRIITVGGTNGSDVNSFAEPYGVAVDDTYVYISDTTNQRIKKHLKSDLSYVSQLGSTLYANQYINTIYNAYGILINGNYLYVANSAYQTIRKYTLDFNYISSIGFSSGYSGDEFVLPRGMTIANGYMYITDSTLGRITKRDLKEFDVNISFIGAGTDFNFFYSPFSVDSDETYYYIVNYAINRVEKRLKSDYSLVTYFGGPYAGALTNFLNIPSDIVVDEEYVYVSDRTNHRILRLNKIDLTYSAQFGTGTAGSTTTTLSSPRQIAINDSNIYVADYTNNRVMILNKSNLTYLAQFGTTGVGNDQFTSITGIAVDSNFIYTSEIGTNVNRIKKINKNTFTCITSIGAAAGSGDTQFNAPHFIALDENNIFVADASNNRIKKHLKSDLSYVSKIGTSGIGNDQFRTPYGITYKDENTLLIADYTNHRIKIHNPSTLAYTSMVDLSTYSTDGLYNPFGVTIDDNFIYIADATNHRIIKKNKITFVTVASIGGPIAGTGNDQFNSPYGIAVDDNFVYVAEYSNNRIKKHNKSDLSWSYTYAPGTGIIYSPVGIVVDGNYLYVTTMYSTTRDWLTKINISSTPWTVAQQVGTTTGSGDDQFSDPRGLTIYGDYIYVVDTANHRIHKRNKNDLSLVQMIGIGVAATSGTNGFNSPFGINIHNDRFYVTDYGNHRIKVFDANFNFLYKFGRYGWGQDLLYYPSDITADDDYVYIADYSNHRIVKRSLLELENIKNISKTNAFGIFGYNANLLSSNRRITSASQIAIKRSGNEFCIYINGIKDNCTIFENTPLNLTFPESNTYYGSLATTETYYISENQNDYPYAIGNFGLVTPGNGSIKYLRLFDYNLTDTQILGLYENG